MKDIYNYKEYKDRAFYLIRQEYGAHTVKTISVPIDNDKSMEGICLHLGTNSVSPIIYFDADKSLYSREDVQVFVEKVKDAYCNLMKFLESEPDDTSWGKMEHRIFPRMLNYDRNREFLKDVPYVKYMDFAVCFFYNTKSKFAEQEYGAITVEEQLRKQWNVTIEEMFHAALLNLKALDCSMKNLDEVAAMCGLEVKEDKSVPLYTLSVYTGMFGAAVILNPLFMHELCQKLQCEKLWIIASSSHELLALPYDHGDEAVKIYQMTMEIDRFIGSEDFLSDKLYVYDDETQQIEIVKEVEGNGQA